MLNGRGSPWAVRWFNVTESRLYRPAFISDESSRDLLTLEDHKPAFISDDSPGDLLTLEDHKHMENKHRTILPDNSNSALSANYKTNLLDDFTVQLIMMSMVGVIGYAIGRISRKQ